MTRRDAAVEAAPASDESTFAVKLPNFEGPFDLLLHLIAKHKLNITEVALSQVTDEFIAHIRSQGESWDLDRTSQFLVVAATLLDLKTARLLPQGDVDDEDDLALLEARDLLFARLLQYRAFRQVSAWIEEVLDSESKRAARPGGLEPAFAGLLPEVVLTTTLEEFARLAAGAMIPPRPPQVALDHVYIPVVSVAEQTNLVAARLRREESVTFRSLAADAGDRLVVVARFLAILELYRSALVTFEQIDPMGELVIRWSGTDDDEPIVITDDYDGAVADSPDSADSAPEPDDAPEEDA
ncbi:MAG: segregation/condensation protein A [Propionibacteriaceae bacterium]|jgi:segregation and condensation protein A|nr:segregation/condensation protein A [Propionibacteriaceae bacterium]